MPHLSRRVGEASSPAHTHFEKEKTMKKTMAMMMAMAAMAAQGQTFYWDAGGSQNGDPSRPRADGSGVWDDTSYLWRDAAGTPADYVCFTPGRPAHFGTKNVFGAPDVVTIPTGGIAANGVTFYKSYTFEGGPILAPGGMSLRNDDFDNPLYHWGQAPNLTTGRFDVAIISGGNMNFTGSPMIFTKPHVGSGSLSFSSGYAGGFYCLSGKEASFMTGNMSASGHGGTVCSEGALNGTRTMNNALFWDIGLGVAAYQDRFVLTGEFADKGPWQPTLSLNAPGQVAVLTGGISDDFKVDNYECFLTTADNIPSAYFFLNAPSALGPDKIVRISRPTAVLGHPDALGDAAIRMLQGGNLAWAPGVTNDVSDRIYAGSELNFNVGSQAIVFTNAMSSTAAGLSVRGKSDGSLTLRLREPRVANPPIPRGGTLVLDYADMPLDGDGVAANLLDFGGAWLSASGGALSVLGKPTGVSSQALDVVALGQFAHISVSVDARTGNATILGPMGYSRDSHSSMELTLVNSNSHAFFPRNTNWTLHYWLSVRTPDGRWHIATEDGGVVCPVAYMPLVPNAGYSGRPWLWSGTVIMDTPISQDMHDCFKADATEEECVLDLGGDAMRVNRILTDGDFGTTVRNGAFNPGGNFIARSFCVYGKGVLTLEADVVITNEIPILKVGPGCLRILGPIGYRQSFVINGGSVAVGHDDALGLLPATRSLTHEIRVQCDATLTATADNLDVKRNIYFDFDRTLTVDVPADKTLTLSGVINNLGGIVKVGAGTLVLANAGNTYFDGTELRAGTVSVSSLKALGHPTCHGLHFGGGVLRITGMDCKTIDSVYVNNWGSFDGGFDIDEAGHTFTIGSPVTVKALGAFITAGAGMLALEDGITLGVGTTLRVIGNVEGNGGIAVGDLDLSKATLEVVVTDKSVIEVAIATTGNYTPPASVTLPPGFALKYRHGKLTAQKDGGSLILVR